MSPKAEERLNLNPLLMVKTISKINISENKTYLYVMLHALIKFWAYKLCTCVKDEYNRTYDKCIFFLLFIKIYWAFCSRKHWEYYGIEKSYHQLDINDMLHFPEMIYICVISFDSYYSPWLNCNHPMVGFYLKLVSFEIIPEFKVDERLNHRMFN